MDSFTDFGENGDDVGLDLPPDLPPGVAERLLDAAAEAARRGESLESFASRVLSGASPGRRRRPHKKKRPR